MYVQVRATRRCGQPRRPRRRSALARAVASNPMCEAATARVVRSLCNLVPLCHRRALLRHTLAQGAYVGVPPPALPDEEEPPEAAPPPPLPTPLPTPGPSGAPGRLFIITPLSLAEPTSRIYCTSYCRERSAICIK